MTLSVREARVDEYEQVARLTLAAYEEYGATLEPEHWQSYRNDLADVARRAGRGPILVAEDDGRLVGAVAYYPPLARAGDPDRWWPSDYAYFRALAVDPAARRRGVGRALTLACIQRAREEGASGVALNTIAVMRAAQAMYERLGFRRIAERGGRSDDGLLFYIFSLNGVEPDSQGALKAMSE